MLITELKIPWKMQTMKPIKFKPRLDDIKVIGVDTETLEGPPITFQFFGDHCPKNGLIKFLDKKSKPTDIFCNCLEEIIDGRAGVFWLVGFNLKFDLLGLFGDRHGDLLTGEFEFKNKKWMIKGVYDTVFFATLRRGNSVVNLIDGALFYTGSNLKKIGELVCPDLPKLEMPKDLGHKMFKKSDKNFVDYAMRDAEIAYHLGLKILEWHREFGVSPCVSAPHLASKIFLKKFLKRQINLPSSAMVNMALSSYHGGKNNITITEATFYKKVYSLDIVSAYPDAMRLMPSFSVDKAYKILPQKYSQKIKVPPYGVYRVSGFARLTSWPIIYDADFKPFVNNYFNDVCITGFEYNQALESRLVEFKSVSGFYYDVKMDKHPSPLKDYVDYFFDKKFKAETKEEILFYKIMLNALYGKFIQNRKESENSTASPYQPFDDDEGKPLKPKKVFVAGGLFHPFIATLITGYVRARIHGIELKYEAIHTATDGIFTFKKPNPADLSTKLGGLKLDAEGPLLLVRGKCYILYSHTSTEGDRELIPSGVYPKLWIKKFATHAYYGKILEFEKMVFEGTNEYKTVKVNQLKESYRSNLVPNKFEKRTFTFNYKKGAKQ